MMECGKSDLGITDAHFQTKSVTTSTNPEGGAV